ncbi:MAG: PucC family protein, partial [Rhodobacteraceae bacterium]|nr:PucC family protein [Paracoccaceae bacterium]
SGRAGRGLALGPAGAPHATARGVGGFLGGAIRDIVNASATSGALGEALATPATGYSVVYHIEIALLFATLVAIGPLVRHAERRSLIQSQPAPGKIGLAELPT